MNKRFIEKKPFHLYYIVQNWNFIQVIAQSLYNNHLRLRHLETRAAKHILFSAVLNLSSIQLYYEKNYIQNLKRKF